MIDEVLGQLDHLVSVQDVAEAAFADRSELVPELFHRCGELEFIFIGRSGLGFGFLFGLVQMLGRLDDPSTIGPSMAVALLTTFYGAVLANMVFLPLAAKLERNSTEEALVNNVYLMGATSIGRQENPRRLEMLLNSLLPPSQRVQYFD